MSEKLVETLLIVVLISLIQKGGFLNISKRENNNLLWSPWASKTMKILVTLDDLSTSRGTGDCGRELGGNVSKANKLRNKTETREDPITESRDHLESNFFCNFDVDESLLDEPEARVVTKKCKGEAEKYGINVKAQQKMNLELLPSNQILRIYGKGSHRSPLEIRSTESTVRVGKSEKLTSSRQIISNTLADSIEKRKEKPDLGFICDPAREYQIEIYGLDSSRDLIFPRCESIVGSAHKQVSSSHDSQEHLSLLAKVIREQRNRPKFRPSLENSRQQYTVTESHFGALLSQSMTNTEQVFPPARMRSTVNLYKNSLYQDEMTRKSIKKITIYTEPQDIYQDPLNVTQHPQKITEDVYLGSDVTCLRSYSNDAIPNSTALSDCTNLSSTEITEYPSPSLTTFSDYSDTSSTDFSDYATPSSTELYDSCSPSLTTFSDFPIPHSSAYYDYARTSPCVGSDYASRIVHLDAPYTTGLVGVSTVVYGTRDSPLNSDCFRTIPVENCIYGNYSSTEFSDSVHQSSVANSNIVSSYSSPLSSSTEDLYDSHLESTVSSGAAFRSSTTSLDHSRPGSAPRPSTTYPRSTARLDLPLRNPVYRPRGINDFHHSDVGIIDPPPTTDRSSMSSPENRKWSEENDSHYKTDKSSNGAEGSVVRISILGNQIDFKSPRSNHSQEPDAKAHKRKSKKPRKFPYDEESEIKIVITNI